MKNKTVTELVNLVTTEQLAYNHEGKEKFHKLAKKVAKEIAHRLNLPSGSYEIRSNKAGIAVCGEVTLHGEHIYIQLSQGWNLPRFMYRYCANQKDYTGGVNQWMDWQDFENFDQAIETFNSLLTKTQYRV